MMQAMGIATSSKCPSYRVARVGFQKRKTTEILTRGIEGIAEEDEAVTSAAAEAFVEGLSARSEGRTGMAKKEWSKSTQADSCVSNGEAVATARLTWEEEILEARTSPVMLCMCVVWTPRARDV
jgi:hypothetical protein